MGHGRKPNPAWLVPCHLCAAPVGETPHPCKAGYKSLELTVRAALRMRIQTHIAHAVSKVTGILAESIKGVGQTWGSGEDSPMICDACYIRNITKPNAPIRSIADSCTHDTFSY
jgi:hypothetical protein